MGQYDAKLMKIYDKRTTLPHLLYQKRTEKRRYAISRPQVIDTIQYHVGTHVHYHSDARKDIHQARSSPSRRAQKQFWNHPLLSILIQYSFNTVQSFSISALFPQNPCIIQTNALSLQHQNPPSLSTMLKWAGRFFICIWQKEYHLANIIQKNRILSLFSNQGDCR